MSKLAFKAKELLTFFDDFCTTFVVKKNENVKL